MSLFTCEPFLPFVPPLLLFSLRLDLSLMESAMLMFVRLIESFEYYSIRINKWFNHLFPIFLFSSSLLMLGGSLCGGLEFPPLTGGVTVPPLRLIELWLGVILWWSES